MSHVRGPFVICGPMAAMAGDQGSDLRRGCKTEHFQRFVWLLRQDHTSSFLPSEMCLPPFKLFFWKHLPSVLC